MHLKGGHLKRSSVLILSYDICKLLHYFSLFFQTKLRDIEIYLTSFGEKTVVSFSRHYLWAKQTDVAIWRRKATTGRLETAESPTKFSSCSNRCKTTGFGFDVAAFGNPHMPGCLVLHPRCCSVRSQRAAATELL